MQNSFLSSKPNPSLKYHGFNIFNENGKTVKTKSNYIQRESFTNEYSFNRFSVLQNNNDQVKNQSILDDEAVFCSNKKNVQNIQKSSKRPQVAANHHLKNHTVFNKKLP